MNKFMDNLLRCEEMARNLHAVMRHNLPLREVATVDPNVPYSHCYRVKFHHPIACTDDSGNDIEVTHLSISYPPDRNRYDDWRIIETAITTENLVYVSELGYSDTCSFSTAAEVVQEIIDIATGISLQRTTDVYCLGKQERKYRKMLRRDDPAYALARKEGRKRTRDARKARKM